MNNKLCKFLCKVLASCETHEQVVNFINWTWRLELPRPTLLDLHRIAQQQHQTVDLYITEAHRRNFFIRDQPGNA